jgi:hypothetical protein
MAQCMAMGQAAGTVTALAVESGLTPREIDHGTLRDRLRRDRAIVDLERAPSAIAS